METGKLWRETVSRIRSDEYTDIELQHLLMDYALFAVAKTPRNFDVLLADNLFGDLMSEMIAVVTGSLGLLPSATRPQVAVTGQPLKGGLYESTHGSAPDISGLGIANPTGAIQSVAMMFEYGLGAPSVARAIEKAVEAAFADGTLTPDLGGNASTDEMTNAVLMRL